MITAYETDSRPLSGFKIHTGQIVLIGDDRTADTFSRLIGPRIDASAVIRVKEMSESLNRIRGCRNPLVILDQSQTGSQFLDQVRSLSEHAPVITLCQTPEMTEQALAAGAVDSILPPYPADRIRTALHKVHRYCVNKNEDGFLNFRQSDRSISLRYNQIVCVVSEKKRSHIELSNGKSFLSTHLLKDLHSRLPEESFIRVHKRYIVNVNHIDYVEYSAVGSNQIHMNSSGSKIIPIGRLFLEGVRLHLSKL